MKMNRKPRLGEKVLIEVEVLSDRINAEGDGLNVDYYKVRVPGHGKPIAVIADSLVEPLQPNYLKTEVDYEATRSHLARAIRKYRQRANLSQHQLAKALGVSQNSISQWESGEFTPRFEKVPVLASFLGIPIEEIFAYE